jgi:2-polyprenyl-3-methyl-5-hydroxy-6-metoxy-1,4-benzoquinol methylase
MILVAIASYGIRQDHYLTTVVEEYRRFGSQCKIVILSDRSKTVAGADVLVGLPSSNPYSLPFAHRALFAKNVDEFDLFIYSEDDTLLTAAHVEAFLSVQRHLPDDEIAGFVRSETAPDGRRYITSIHHHFRWAPGSAERRGGELFARLSNLHSGCYVATRAHLKKAIASGGFLVSPHAETYGMLEAAASDIYRQCGLRRVLCISRIHDFIVPHLPNKYFGEMGIPIEELERQVRALSTSDEGTRRTSLVEPQTRAPGFRWSKDLYGRPDPGLLQAIPRGARTLLSIGAASGQLEEELGRRGIEVHAIPVDAVFAETLEARRIRTVEGPLESAVQELEGRRFDVVLMADTLHLADNPSAWLRSAVRLLGPQGLLVLRVDNTTDLWSWLKDVRAGFVRSPRPSYDTLGVHAVSPRLLRRWCRDAGVQVRDIAPVVEESRRRRLRTRVPLRVEHLLASKFILTAQLSTPASGMSRS